MIFDGPQSQNFKFRFHLESYIKVSFKHHKDFKKTFFFKNPILGARKQSMGNTNSEFSYIWRHERFNARPTRTFGKTATCSYERFWWSCRSCIWVIELFQNQGWFLQSLVIQLSYSTFFLSLLKTINRQKSTDSINSVVTMMTTNWL